MVDCLWLETVSWVTLSPTRKDDAIVNDFWRNTAEQVASHTKIDFGLKLLATTVIFQFGSDWLFIKFCKVVTLFLQTECVTLVS